MADTPPHDDIATTSRELTCPICWTPFTRVRRQRYCSDNCRKTAWVRKTTAAAAAPQLTVPPPTRRRDSTVYTCPACDTRYHAQQWCFDCNTPCTRVGLGGLCPHCDEPVAITDLLDRKEARNR